MKVCMITGALPPLKCGVGDYSDILCDYLNKNPNIELNVITSSNIHSSFNYNIYNLINKWSISELTKVLKIVKKLNPDIVHIQYPTLSYKRNIMINMLPYFLHKRYKVIVTLHEYSDSSILGKVRSEVGILFSHFLIVVDDRYNVDLRRKKIFSKKPIKKICIGSNIPKSKKTYSELLKLRNKLLLKNKKMIVGYFGFINDKKGLENIVLALKLLKDNGYKEFQFNIIGELYTNNKYHNKIVNMINDLGLNKEVIITGYLEKQLVGDYVKVCDVIVLPFTDGLSSKNGSFLCALQEEKNIITTYPQIENVYNIYKKNQYIHFVDRVNNYKEIYDQLIKVCSSVNFKVTKNQSVEYLWHNIADEHYKVYRLLSN
ncbi:glycosyltransferase [Clostridium felsineum]|uniref:glycosyltransferase n=1 Tax=Clostridium felsineum TaxID=36839 RepID=UPI00214DC2FD|nr:glycosyltransferase [Clostridium felsineum]MCR3757947.1 glycosyltransferase [Clostridium felsineum]